MNIKNISKKENILIITTMIIQVRIRKKKITNTV